MYDMFELIETYFKIPYLGLIFFFTLSLLFIYEMLLNIRDMRCKTDLDQGTRLMIYLLIIIGILIGVYSSIFSSILWSINPSIILTFSLLLIWGGMLIRFWVLTSLGTYFRTIISFQKGQKIRVTGLYRYIRHPYYLGSLIQMFGLAILFRNWIGFCGLFFFVSIGLFWRMNIEEEYLISIFGEEYLSYMKRTNRLIPKIY